MCSKLRVRLDKVRFTLPIFFQSVFDDLDQEEEGVIAVDDLIAAIRNLNPDVDNNQRVQTLFTELKCEEMNEVEYAMFCRKLEEADWSRKKDQKISDSALKKIFNQVDVDKSGSISRRVK